MHTCIYNVFDTIILKNNYKVFIILVGCRSCCNANGQCVGGKCQCQPGFEGNDCGRSYRATCWTSCIVHVLSPIVGTQTGTTYTLNRDPADPVIMIVGSVDGEQLQVLGDKDGSGAATSVDSLILDDGEETTFVTHDNETSLLNRVSTTSGVNILYDWSDDLTHVYVTAISPDGAFQVTVNVNLSNITDTNSDIKRDISETDFLAHSKRQAEGGRTVNVPVNVYHCNKPEPNARVYGLAPLNYDADRVQWTGEKVYRAVSTVNEGIYHIQIFKSQQEQLPALDKSLKMCVRRSLLLLDIHVSCSPSSQKHNMCCNCRYCRTYNYSCPR